MRLPPLFAVLLCLAASLSSRADEVQDRLDVARVKIRAGKLPEALEVLNGLVQSAPARAEVYAVLAEAYERSGDLEGALQALTRLKDLLAEARKERPLTAQEERWLKDAKAQEARVVEFRAKEDEILRRFRDSALDAAQTLLKNGKPEQAALLVRELQRLFPEDPSVLNLLRRLPKKAP